MAERRHPSLVSLLLLLDACITHQMLYVLSIDASAQKQCLRVGPIEVVMMTTAILVKRCVVVL